MTSDLKYVRGVFSKKYGLKISIMMRQKDKDKA